MEKYTKIGYQGTGNFGKALLVQSKDNAKMQYIIKMIDLSKMEDKKQRQEALQEVQVLKQMRHPYIISYRESFMEKKQLCIVMDFADGGDLFTKISKQKQNKVLFPENMILEWFVQMAMALKHVHAKKVLHRDLKTQNIFLTADNAIKMGDFGIAKVLQHTYDYAKTAIGTPYYLSPEICKEQPYNQKSDIWSLGCILYELTTLNHAFDSNSMKGLVSKILKGTYPDIPAQYSNDLRQLIAEMLTKDPKQRPSIRKIMEKDFIKKIVQELYQTTKNKQQQKQQQEMQDKINKENNFLQDYNKLQSNHSKNQLISNNSKKTLNQNNNRKSISPFTRNQNINQNSGVPNVSVSSQQSNNSYIQQQQQILKNQQNFFISNQTHQKENENDYGILLESLKDCIDGNIDQEDEITDSIFPMFLFTQNGHKVQIDNLCENDRICQKIELLRVYLEKNIGPSFIEVYKFYQQNQIDEVQIKRLLGNKIEYFPLVIQLTVCEDQAYG